MADELLLLQDLLGGICEQYCPLAPNGRLSLIKHAALPLPVNHSAVRGEDFHWLPEAMES